MTIRKKVRILLISCLLMVTLLCWIQYRLVRNTYDLNAKAYLTEVTRKLDVLGQPFVDSANHRAVKAVIQHVSWYISNHDRSGFLDSLSRVVAHANYHDQQRLAALLDSAFGDLPVKLTMQYASIVLTIDGVGDTLLNSTETPFIIFGKPVSGDPVDIGEGIQTNSFTGNDLGTGAQKPRYTLTVWYVKTADISGWRQQVGQNMAGVFLLAGALIAGIVILFYVMFRTLLQQKKLADIQTDLTNNITHELRTPLSSLAIIIKTLRKTISHERFEVHHDLITSLERQHHKLLHIVDRVLESAWVADAPLQMKACEMNSLVRQTATDFPMETHSLKLNIPQDEVWMNTDEYVLTSIIHNLLDNGAKYSDAGTQLVVQTRLDKDCYLITIQDHGKGIARSEHEKIFSKFYRIAEKDLHTVKGVGLGLYLCMIHTKRLNGTLSVASEPSKGSTFTLSFTRT